MRIWKAREIEASLTKKGFGCRKTHHNLYFLYVDGKKSSIYTKISHDSREYGGQLFSLMAKQLQLTREELDQLIACPLTYERYIELLQERGVAL